MSKKPITRYFLTVAVVAFLAAFVASDALAVSTGGVSGTLRQFGVYSPYWQSDASSYTFISVTHPSLNGMASQIGVRVRARGLTNALTGSGNAGTGIVEFTINKATTMKVFIAATNNATINSTSITNAAGFLINTSNFVGGDLVVSPISVNTASTAPNNDTNGFRDVTMLTLWGAVVVQSSSTGFAMEFVGDLQDSRNPLNTFAPTTAGGYTASGTN